MNSITVINAHANWKYLQYRLMGPTGCFTEASYWMRARAPSIWSASYNCHWNTIALQLPLIRNPSHNLISPLAQDWADGLQILGPSFNPNCSDSMLDGATQRSRSMGMRFLGYGLRFDLEEESSAHLALSENEIAPSITNLLTDRE